MKTLNDFEKKIVSMIERISRIPGGLNTIGNIIEPIIGPDVYIELTETNTPIKIKYSFVESISKTNVFELSDFVHQLNDKILAIVELFEMLEQEREISLTGELDITFVGQKVTNATYVSMAFEDKEIMSKFF
jgi:hypothetical protein